MESLAWVWHLLSSQSVTVPSQLWRTGNVAFTCTMPFSPHVPNWAFPLAVREIIKPKSTKKLLSRHQVFRLLIGSGITLSYSLSWRIIAWLETVDHRCTWVHKNTIITLPSTYIMGDVLITRPISSIGRIRSVWKHGYVCYIIEILIFCLLVRTTDTHTYGVIFLILRCVFVTPEAVGRL